MEVSGQLHASAALPPGKEPLMTIEQEAAWAPEPLWTRFRREKFPAPPHRESNPDHPNVQPEASPHTDWAMPAHNSIANTYLDETW
jgi:hypothetical protein